MRFTSTAHYSFMAPRSLIVGCLALAMFACETKAGTVVDLPPESDAGASGGTGGGGTGGGGPGGGAGSGAVGGTSTGAAGAAGSGA
jgi:hypothetical protein